MRPGNSCTTDDTFKSNRFFLKEKREMMRFKSDRRYEINLRALQVTNKKLIWMRDQKKKLDRLFTKLLKPSKMAVTSNDVPT